MAKRQITDAWLRSLKLGPGERVEVTDARCPGLRLRASARTMSWSLVTKTPAGYARVYLGDADDMGVDEARQAADRKRAELKSGTSTPAPDTGAGLGFDTVAAAYVELRRSEGMRSVEKLAYYLKEPSREWAGSPIARMRREDVFELLDRIAARGAPVTARNTLVALSGLFSWADDRGFARPNPIADARRRKAWASKPRKRVLILSNEVGTDDELRTLWRHLDRDDTGLSVSTRFALKALITTAQRPGEVAGMAIADLDLERRVWVQKEGTTKSGRRHVVPLSAAALNIVAEAIGDRTSGPVFPSPKRPGKPLLENALGQACWRLSNGDGAILPPFSAHDLRRTSASLARREGAALSDVAALLGHVEQGVTATTYARDEQRIADKRRALDVLELALEKVLGTYIGSLA